MNREKNTSQILIYEFCLFLCSSSVSSLHAAWPTTSEIAQEGRHTKNKINKNPRINEN